MGYLVFDTETTGLLDFKKPADDPSQPHLASIAMIETDAFGIELDRTELYVKPNGWTMPAEAQAINGLTTEFLMENGTPIEIVLDVYEGYVRRGLSVVAFNVQFDIKMMRAEFRRLGRDDLFSITRNSCLMRSLKPYQARGLDMRAGQFVTLAKACEFFGITNSGAHSASGDANAALSILQILLGDGNLIPPAVHLANKAVA